MVLLAPEAQVVVPDLRPEHSVVMDNLSSHRGHRTPNCIRAAEAELVYLPPPSPDLNPIELAFGTHTQPLRSRACHTATQPSESMKSVLDAVTPTDAEPFFRHRGYATD